MAKTNPPVFALDGPERWRHIERLFYGAMDLPEAARMDFLNAEAGADVRLHAELLALLEADAEARRRLDHVVTEAVISWLRSGRR
jgi:hypothetical protein